MRSVLGMRSSAGTRLATALLGDRSRPTCSWSATPIRRLIRSGDSILQAIEMNGVAIAMNKASFLWGRRAASRPGRG